MSCAIDTVTVKNTCNCYSENNCKCGCSVHNCNCYGKNCNCSWYEGINCDCYNENDCNCGFVGAEYKIFECIYCTLDFNKLQITGEDLGKYLDKKKDVQIKYKSLLEKDCFCSDYPYIYTTITFSNNDIKRYFENKNERQQLYSLIQKVKIYKHKKLMSSYKYSEYLTKYEPPEQTGQLTKAAIK